MAGKSDSAIRKAIAGDPDIFIPDATWWARAEVVQPPAKRAVSIRIDADVLAWFRTRGPGYQTRINAVLRSYAEAARARRAPAAGGSSSRNKRPAAKD